MEKLKEQLLSIHSSGQTHISLKIEEIVSLENEIDWTTVSFRANHRL